MPAKKTTTKPKKKPTKKSTLTEGNTRGAEKLIGSSKKKKTKPKGPPPAPKPKSKAKPPAIKPEKKRVFVYKRISSSMMKTFLQCKRKFHRHYIDGLQEPANPSFTLGNGCHDALERANLSLIENPRKLSKEDIEGFVQDARNYIAKEYVNTMELFETAEELVESELINLNYDEKILQAEEKFDIITPEGVRIYGFIDKVVEVDPNTIKIVDYKTSVMPLSYEEAKVDPQLSMYELAAAVLYPEYKNRLVALKYLRTGKELVTSRSPIAQLKFRKQLLSVQDAIIEYVAKAQDVEAVGVVNNLCNWCSFRTNCKEYLTQISTVDESYLSIDDMRDDLFINEYVRAGVIKKAIEDYRDRLKLWALRRIEENPDVGITNGEQVANTFSATRKSFNPTFVSKHLTYEQFASVVTINNSKMNKLLDSLENEDVKLKIEQSAEVKFNSPQFRMRKV